MVKNQYVISETFFTELLMIKLKVRLSEYKCLKILNIRQLGLPFLKLNRVIQQGQQYMLLMA